MIFLDHSSSLPLYKQIYTEIKDSIINGDLVEDEPLPSIRALEKELNVSRNTVDRAYRQLVAEGYARSSQGKRFFVENIYDFDEEPDLDHAPRHSPIHQSCLPRVTYDFGFESMESDLFPWSKWRRYLKEAVEQTQQTDVLSYGNMKGNRYLRTMLCDFLFRHRGVKAEPEQVVVGAGTQYLMDIILSLFSPLADRVAFEEPGYLAMRSLIESRGLLVPSIPVLDSGLCSYLLGTSNSNLVYTTPSHQFPTGTALTIGMRNMLLTWAARRKDAYIIENDYDSEFRHGSLPVPSLQSLDQAQKVIYLGTLSKLLSPGIRCAFMVLPPALLSRYEEDYRFFNAALPEYHQIAIGRMIEDGVLDQHMRKLSTREDRKYTLLIKSIRTYLDDRLEIVGQPAGTHVVVRIRNCRNQEALLSELERRSIRIYSFKEHCHEKSRAYENLFLMGYHALLEDDIPDACQALARALEDIG